ncbi:MAG: HEAT repeat domain-containing protein, partial [Rhodothermales bacterium]
MQDVYEHEAHLRRVLAPERSDENDWLPDHNGDGSRDWRDLMVNTERLYRLTDRDGDGVADRSEKLVEGFNTPVSDVLGGLLLHDGDIYLSSAPVLYRLVDGTTDPKPEVSTVSWGYNVHPGFNGHGMSGVTVGPDGRIYWGVGDMGFSVTAPDGSHHHYPNQGAVLRSFPDGSGFEVFATGLRNTHEFDFDDRGNLISVDNDGDHPGEMERIVYIVDGSDSGWRVNWQFGKYGEDRNNDYKVWMDEELFKPHFDGQAAYITPPISNYHSGPAGFAYNPGTALGEEWSGHFFMSEYTGSPATTNVHAFRLDEQGAGFTLAEERVAVSGVLTVGIGFGPDGALYLADWIDGWVSKGAGRVWRLDASDPPADLRARTRELLNANYDAASTAELFDRLNYDDLRVRRKAQFELAARGDEETLLRAAREGASLHARLHGLWGLWQRALLDAGTAESFVEFLGDEEAEVRAQAAKILGDVRYAPAAESLVPRLADASDRVRFFAAQALGCIAYGPAFDAVVAMLAENDGRDVYLRHAGALALARIGDAGALVALADHASEAVRVAAVVALRRMRHEGAAAFLDDASAHVVTEAARAINDDGGIDAAIPDLAALLGATPHTRPAQDRRVIR